ncbi:hypothetical protein ACRYI5_04480 [Furfurilactobacillus sp. WILCCON 0119]
MNYVIFGLELLAILLWLIFGAHTLWLALIGVAIIIVVSQLLHILLKAR